MNQPTFVWLPLGIGRARVIVGMMRASTEDMGDETFVTEEWFGHERWCPCDECAAQRAHALHVHLDTHFERAMAFCPGVLDKQ